MDETLLNSEILPHTWGEGALFAYSGIDGPTHSASQFTAALDQLPFNFLIHTPYRARLVLKVNDAGQVLAAANDVLVVRTLSGDSLRVTFSEWHTLCGLLPEDGFADLQAVDTPENAPPGYGLLPAGPAGAGYLALGQSGFHFALSFGCTPEEAQARVALGLKCNVDQAIEDRLAFIRRLPVLSDPAETRFLRKCASVMKVNSLAPEGAIRRRWSTPDRVPHQHMWLWDSVFHAMGMNYLDPDLAWEYLLAMLEHAHPDGCMPITVKVDGSSYPMTQPPVLAWGVWENYKAGKDLNRLAQALPALEAYLDWNLQHRDQNGNGLLEWLIEEHEDCRSGESGMDNSPRFDSALTLDAVDFSTFQAHDMYCLAGICQALGLDERAERWRARAERTSQAIHAWLWDSEVRFYCDRDLEGRSTRVRAVSGFLPLLLPDLPPARALDLLQAMNDPAAFAAAFPLPSLALDHPQWSTDMWRGSTWINFNYLVVQGLRRSGFLDQAAGLAEATLAAVRRAYERFGVIFEFFDASGQRTPPECDRKGPRRLPYDIRRKYDSIRDFHWSAALCLALLFERENARDE